MKYEIKLTEEDYADLKQAVVDAAVVVDVIAGDDSKTQDDVFAAVDKMCTAVEALLTAQKPKTRVEWLWVYVPLSEEVGFVMEYYAEGTEPEGEGWVKTRRKREVE